jgi:hypothetical protein
MKKLLVLLFSILISLNSLGETVLYCQEDLVAGFIKKNGSWQLGNFRSERHTIKFNDDYSKLFGLDENRHYSCSPAYSSSSNSLVCLSGYNNGQSFIYNKNKKRFVFNNFKPNAGYDINGNDTDILSAGTCKEF